MESSREHRKRTRSNPSVAREEEETVPRCPASKRVSGGIYVPPHSETAANNDEAAYERRSWDALRKSLTGLINKATPAHIRHVARELLAENLFALRRAQFKGHPPVRPELDLIKPEDQVTHQIELCDRQLDPEVHLDVFKPSPSFFRDEAAYEDLKRGMLGEDAGGNGDSIQSSVEEPDCSGDESDEEEESETDSVIRDDTETNLTNLRRTIYLTVMSSVDSEEAGHKLMSVVRPGQKTELCSMLLECCRKERAYTRYYGQLGQRLCAIHPAYQAGFEACFASHYSTLHRVETNELRATAMFFAHLLATDALPWRGVLGRVRVTEDDTTSSSRIFIKMLFQDLSEHLGVSVLSRKMNQDDTEVRDALFPRDCAKNMRFAINFFTAIGLGSVTSPARELLLQY
ncbi:unnamed protein product [Urochloa decumbens]|uniref:MI domain-containing protein n=1 Tax=Urochloa decumbens TaxID=240449 RepID=A0ABC8WDJ5_9POAL